VPLSRAKDVKQRRLGEATRHLLCFACFGGSHFVFHFFTPHMSCLGVDLDVCYCFGHVGQDSCYALFDSYLTILVPFVQVF
jgi:hypothetical protein